MNAFESGQRKNIPAVLIYAFSADGARVLLMHRNLREAARDVHAGKWNGLGGKQELDESPRATAVREFAEEAGVELAAERMRALGSLFFPHFKPHKSEDWSVTVFVCKLGVDEEKNVVKRNHEGELAWVTLDSVLDRPLWDGDRVFLPAVLARKPFCGTFWYRDGVLAHHEFAELAAPGSESIS